jgi:16S rRNA G1207 methylase RsmC
MNGRRIMDAGCGHGLLGIYCLLKEPKIVVFNDYNIDVL